MFKGIRNEEPDAELVQILQGLPALRASDLHLISDEIPRVRVDGTLFDLPGAQVWPGDLVVSRIASIMSQEQRDRFDQDLELDFSFTLEKSVRFRINIYKEQGSLGAAIRVILPHIMSLEQLGVPASLARFTGLPRGLVLVTGPTGSGKSTTLAAMIDRINKTRKVHVITIEDPIEFLHENLMATVNQREVGVDTHSFADALNHVLRQDPDVILIGEMRDHETISAALTAAETGHLVFATLHTQDAAQTIDRIVDVFPSDQQSQVRIQLALTLKGLVSQVLVPHASGEGRVVAAEVLVVTPAIANMIRENKSFQIPTTMMAGREQGMQSLDQDLAEHVQNREITVQNAFEVAHDREALMRLIGREMNFAEDTTRSPATPTRGQN
jgi:twitching motility protein PilT